MRDKVATLKNILFGYNSEFSIIVGPVRLNQKHVMGGQLIHGTVPHIHEHGGTMGHREKFRPFSLQAAIDLWGEKGGREFVDQFGVMPSGFYRDLLGNEEFEHRVDRQLDGIWVPVGRRRRDRWLQRTRNAKYPRRPFMEPAVRHVIQNRFPNLYVYSSNPAGLLAGAA